MVTDLLSQIAVDSGKQPNAFRKYARKLEKEMIDSLDDLRLLSDLDWIRLHFPIGLVNKIRVRLNCEQRRSRKYPWHQMLGSDTIAVFAPDEVIRQLICNEELTKIVKVGRNAEAHQVDEEELLDKLWAEMLANPAKFDPQLLPKNLLKTFSPLDSLPDKPEPKKASKIKKKRKKPDLTEWRVADHLINKRVHVPNLKILQKDPFAFSLLGLKPTHVYFNKRFTCFGMSMSDGQKIIGGYGTYEKVAQLPDNIKKIEIYFMVNEHQMHSMKFIGDTELTIGNVDKFRTPADERRGRLDTFTMPPGMMLLGCTIDMESSQYTFGVTFTTCPPFTKEAASDRDIILGFVKSDSDTVAE